MAAQQAQPIVVENKDGGLLEGPYCAICHFPGVDVCFSGCSCQVHAVRVVACEDLQGEVFYTIAFCVQCSQKFRDA